VLKAVVPTRKMNLPKMPLETSSPEAASKGARSVFWADKNDFRATRTYSFEKLRSGNMIEGPAVVEGEYTTLVIPPSCKFSIDEHGLGILE
jgi:acetophenone carboxylase